MITLICHQNSSRLRYIATFLAERFGIEINILSNLKAKLNPKDVIINYTNQQIPNSFSIYNEGLLLEKHLRQNDEFPLVKKVGEDIQLFPSDLDLYHINFDVLSAIFFCLSRYEEYLPFHADKHGRFTARQSHAYANDYLRIPVVDMWVKQLMNGLNDMYTLNLTSTSRYHIQPTIDVDVAWAFQNRKLSHRIASSIKNLTSFNWRVIKSKQKFKKEHQDPYDTFVYLRDSIQHLNPIYFILMNFKRPYDTAHYIEHPAFASLISSIKEFSEIGIHPSYNSFENSSKVAEEKEDLELLIGKPILKSRQHFLRLSMPSTYESLMSHHIHNDYSMGYAEEIGFRSGTSLSFSFYHLEKEELAAFKIHPFCIMDVSLKQYLNFTNEEALDEVKKMKHLIRETNGCLNFIWHNSSFAEFEGWSGWEKVFEELLRN